MNINAHPFNNEPKEEIINCNLTKDALWSNLKLWVSTFFNSYKYTVDMEDKESGRLILKYNTKNNLSEFTDSNISATIQVDVKDMKYRVRIFDATYEIEPSSNCKDLNYMSNKKLSIVETELESAETLMSSGNKIYSDLINTCISYQEKIRAVPQYKKPKDEKKGKENPEYTRLKTVINMAEKIEELHKSISENIISSLKSELNKTDDF